MSVRDRIEFRSRTQLQAWQLARLQSLLTTVSATNSFWQAKLRAANVDVRDVRSLADVRRLPLTTKEELVADQMAHPPYGTNRTFDITRYSRLHQTSGTSTGQPLRWLDTADSWQAMLDAWTSIYGLMGLRPEDRLCFPFSFGPFLGFWAGFEGALRQGNFCLAAGGMNSEARLQLILGHGITILGCTPTYALRLAEVANEKGIDIAASTVRAILVAGEPGGGQGTVRQRIEAAWGARVFDHWGMTELGPLSIECEDDPGCLTLLETECLAEIIDLQSGEPCPRGRQGELVITTLNRTASPVLRYRTGDIVQEAVDDHPSGRCLLRLQGGILGRTDDMLIVRGNNVFPSSIESIVREFPEVVEFRIVLTRQREMPHVRIEIEPRAEISAVPEQGQSLVQQLAGRIKERLQFQAEVTLREPGSLPRFEMKARRVVREDV